MFPTSIAGSLPKPSWLAEPGKLWAPWRLAGAELDAAKLDATLVAIKLQEDAGIDIVTDGEQSRQHFVHGFLESVNGIDFAKRVEMGIRNDRYKAMVPSVTGPLSLKSRVHATEARFARAHTAKKLKLTLPGPMTIVDTIADRYYGDRIKMAFAFADVLNQEARALEADGVDVIQFDEPAFNVYMDEATQWGIDALHRAAAGLTCATAVHICYGYGSAARRHRCGDRNGRNAQRCRRPDRRRAALRAARAHRTVHQLRHGANAPRHRGREAHGARCRRETRPGTVRIGERYRKPPFRRVVVK